MAGGLLVEQPQRVRERLAGQDVEPAAGVPAGQVRGRLAPPVADQHAGVAERAGQPGRRRVRGVVTHEADRRGIHAGQRLGDEAGRLLRIADPQVVPGIVQPHRVGRTALGGIVGVGHRVEVGRFQPGLAQAPGGGQFGQFPRGKRNRTLAVLAPAEAFLFRRRDDPPVDHQRGRRVVEDGVDPEYSHASRPSPVSQSITDRGATRAPGTQTEGRKACPKWGAQLLARRVAVLSHLCQLQIVTLPRKLVLRRTQAAGCLGSG